MSCSWRGVSGATSGSLRRDSASERGCLSQCYPYRRGIASFVSSRSAHSDLGSVGRAEDPRSWALGPQLEIKLCFVSRYYHRLQLCRLKVGYRRSIGLVSGTHCYCSCWHCRHSFSLSAWRRHRRGGCCSRRRSSLLWRYDSSRSTHFSSAWTGKGTDSGAWRKTVGLYSVRPHREWYRPWISCRGCSRTAMAWPSLCWRGGSVAGWCWAPRMASWGSLQFTLSSLQAILCWKPYLKLIQVNKVEITAI